MTTTARCCLAAAFFVLIHAAPLFARDLPVPAISRRVTDLAELLSADEAQALETKLGEFEKATSNQIAVVTIPSLEGESLEDFSIRIAEKNQFGKKGRDNGVLLIIARDDRALRIEVGRGLEGVLTDALSGQIIRREITPAFRKGRYADGINAGIEAIMSATRGEYTGDDGGTGRGFPTPILFVLIFLMFGVFSLISRARRRVIGSGGHRMGPWWWGGGGMGGFGGSGGGWSGGGGSSWGGGGGSFGGGGASGSW